jgi:hypothetical protein
MTQSEIEAFIIAHWKACMAEKGEDSSAIGPLTILLQSTGADSLDLAVLVSQLEECTGRDPFAATVPEFQTIRDLARLYAG